MKATALVFRMRALIFLLLYVLGFLAPWERLFGSGRGTAWLNLSAMLTRSGVMGLASATLAITIAALASITLGALLRVWGTAHLGYTTMQAAALKSNRIADGGPYGHLRNPLYLGAWLLALGTSVLMPAAGAGFFLAGITVFIGFLIFAEERFLSATLGIDYGEYRRRVPRFAPRFAEPRFAPRSLSRENKENDASVQPQWLHALLAETFPVAFMLCFAVFAWRYNAHILVQCLLVCYGLSLVTRAMLKKGDA